jgi:copper(I)-binding protein
VGRAEQKSRLAVVVALASGFALAAAGCSAGQITQTDTQVATVDGASGNVGSIAVRNAQFAFPVSGHEYEPGSEASVVVTIVNNGATADKLLSVTGEGGGAAELGGDVDLEPQTSIGSLFDELDRSSTRSTPSVTTTSAPSGSSSPSSSSTAPTSGSASSDPSLTGSSTPSSAAGSSSTAGSSSGRPSATASSSATPGKPGKVTIAVKLAEELRPGHTVKVTFLFEKAGPITLDLPIGSDPKPRPEGKTEH